MSNSLYYNTFETHHMQENIAFTNWRISHVLYKRYVPEVSIDYSLV